MTTETQSLDQQIARLVFGLMEECDGGLVFTRDSGLRMVCTQRPTERYLMRPVVEAGSLSPRMIHTHPAPPYSTDIREAFRVVDAMEARDWLLGLMRWSVPDDHGYGGALGWRATFGHNDGRMVGEIATIPAEAICLAALAALEHEGDTAPAKGAP